MRSVTSGIAESHNREHFARKRNLINICLIILSLVIVLVPISYIIRSHVIYVKDKKNFIALYQDKRFLDLQITFQWFSVFVNLAITINLIVMTCMAIRTLRSFFANAFASNIRQIITIFYSFTVSQFLRCAYEIYENVRNYKQLH